MHSFEKKIDRFFLSFLPFCYLILAISNIFLDHHTALIRAPMLALGILLGVLTPHIFALSSILLTATWFEIPVLELGFRNQFLIDFLIIGVLTGIPIRKRFFGSQETHLSETKNFALHPFFFPLLFAALFTLSAFVWKTFELRDLSLVPFSKFKYIEGVIRKIFDWDVENNPFHDLSLLFGASLVLCISYHVFILRKLISTLRFEWAVLFGLIPVFLLSLFQWFNRNLVSSYSIDIGGTLQNGNHLSFAAGLGLFLIAALWVETNKTGLRILLLLLTMLSLCALVIGEGRASLLADLICFGALGLRYRSVFSFRSLTKLRFILPLIILIGLIFQEPIIRNTQSVRDVFLMLFHEKSLLPLLTAGGRDEHFYQAIQMILDHPFLGLGLGNFFIKSQTGYDLHNSYLSWFVDFGCFAFLIVLISSLSFAFLFINLLFRTHARPIHWIYGAGVVYLALTFLVDIFILYRSLALLVSFFLTRALTLLMKENFIVLVSFKKRFVFIAGLGFLMGGLTYHNPQSRLVVQHPYQKESIEHPRFKAFSWNSLAYSLDLPVNHCAFVDLKPVFFAVLPMDVILTSPGVSTLPSWTSQDLFRWSKEQPVKQSVIIPPHDWSRVCLCHRTQSDVRLHLIARKGQYMSFAKGFHGVDDRFISYGIGAQGIAEKSMFRSEQTCTLQVEF